MRRTACCANSVGFSASSTRKLSQRRTDTAWRRATRISFNLLPYCNRRILTVVVGTQNTSRPSIFADRTDSFLFARHHAFDAWAYGCGMDKQMNRKWVNLQLFSHSTFADCGAICWRELEDVNNTIVTFDCYVLWASVVSLSLLDSVFHVNVTCCGWMEPEGGYSLTMSHCGPWFGISWWMLQ